MNSNINLLNSDSPQITQPDNLDIELYPYQKSSIHRMSELETAKIIKIVHTEKELEIDTRVGILADKVGAGKTVEIMGLLCNDIDPSNRFYSYEQYTSPYFNIKTLNISESQVQSNLIVVPHNLVDQWIEIITKSSLTYYVINRQKKLQAFNEMVDIPDIILVSSTFISKCDFKLYWKRIIIDEPHIVKMPVKFSYTGNFIWLICATPELCFSSGARLFNKLFGLNYHQIVRCGLSKAIIVKNQDDYIEQSRNLPNIIEIFVNCLTPTYLNMFHNVIPPNIMELLQAGCITEAIDSLECESGTTENIIKSLTKYYETQLHNVNSNIEYINNLIIGYNDRQARLAPKIQERDQLTAKIEGIKKRICEINDSTCPICIDEFTNPTVTPCCQNAFCLECIIQSISHTKKCPYCREPIYVQQLCSIVDNQEDDTQDNDNQDNDDDNIAGDETRTKIENLIKIINESDATRSFLVFSKFDNTFKDIKTKLGEESISYDLLKGSQTSIKKKIEKFSEKKTKVILLNSDSFGSGLNLEMASDIIIYHRLQPDMKTQVIGRAQRIGRQGPLNVHYLAYGAEY